MLGHFVVAEMSYTRVALENLAEQQSLSFHHPLCLPLPSPPLQCRVTRHEISEQDVIGWSGVEWSGVAQPDPALNIKWSWL